MQPLCRIAWLRFRSGASSKNVDPSITPPRSRVASLMLLIMHWPIFSSEERERESPALQLSGGSLLELDQGIDVASLPYL